MTVIGLSGVARAGKDTFCQLLIEELAKENIKAKRFALADQLKADIAEFLRTKLNIDIYSCLPEEKELVRPLLVDYGKIKRILSQGQHWTHLLANQIGIVCGLHDIEVAIVTDVRYDIFPEDELTWLKDIMGGVLVHITRYHGYIEKEITEGIFPNGTLFHRAKNYILPPNPDESLNDPRVKAKADYCVEWETGDIEGVCRVEVQKFLSHLRNQPINPFNSK